MKFIPWYYRRNLPHYQPPDAQYFVTFRLTDSLPIEVVGRLKREQLEAERPLLNIKGDEERKAQLYHARKRYFGKFDHLLDGDAHGPHWLSDERIAGIVADAIHFRDEKEYELHAYTVMPNHVHMVFTVERFAESLTDERDSVSPYVVTDIIGSLKKHTALESNKILHRKGQFWQHESYDHLIRNEKELRRTIWYVLNNPVKAGLVGEWTEWRWSWCREEVG